jgi:uncharacterized membrane protein
MFLTFSMEVTPVPVPETKVDKGLVNDERPEGEKRFAIADKVVGIFAKAVIVPAVWVLPHAEIADELEAKDAVVGIFAKAVIVPVVWVLPHAEIADELEAKDAVVGVFAKAVIVPAACVLPQAEIAPKFTAKDTVVGIFAKPVIVPAVWVFPHIAATVVAGAINEGAIGTVAKPNILTLPNIEIAFVSGIFIELMATLCIGRVKRCDPTRGVLNR